VSQAYGAELLTAKSAVAIELQELALFATAVSTAVLAVAVLAAAMTLPAELCTAYCYTD
jgi:hypothetical protein